MGTKKAPIFWIDAHCIVGILGLEPRMTGPESVVLPLHHIPLFLFVSNHFLFAIAKVRIFFEPPTFFQSFFLFFQKKSQNNAYFYMFSDK